MLRPVKTLDNRVKLGYSVPMTFEQTYSDGTPRPAVMAQLPDWALREFLGRHAGPALETAKAEAQHSGWEE